MTSLSLIPRNERLGRGLLDALGARRFLAMQDLLDPDVRLRGLLGGERHDFHGAEAVTAAFRDWFGDADEFALLRWDADSVADRLLLTYRARLRQPGEAHFELAEQHACCEVRGGRITSIDLLCTGLRPEPRAVAATPRLAWAAAFAS